MPVSGDGPLRFAAKVKAYWQYSSVARRRFRTSSIVVGAADHSTYCCHHRLRIYKQTTRSSKSSYREASRGDYGELLLSLLRGAGAGKLYDDA